MLAESRIFPCPNCREYIDTNSPACRFCSAPVDAAAAITAADLQDKVNQACSDASYIRTATGVYTILLILNFFRLPLVGWGLLILFFALPVMLIRWHLQFGRLKSDDPDLKTARKRKNLALIVWLAIPGLSLLALIAATML